MKKDIHPKYEKNAKITCACGAKYDVGSTKGKMEVEICAQCHPFYTGKQKYVDSAGMVKKFENRLQKTDAKKKESNKTKTKKEDKKEKKGKIKTEEKSKKKEEDKTSKRVKNTKK